MLFNVFCMIHPFYLTNCNYAIFYFYILFFYYSDIAVTMPGLQAVFFFQSNFFEVLHVLLTMKEISIQVKSLIISFVFSVCASMQSHSSIAAVMSSNLPPHLKPSPSPYRVALDIIALTSRISSSALPNPISSNKLMNTDTHKRDAAKEKDRKNAPAQKNKNIQKLTKQQQDPQQIIGLPMKTGKLLVPLLRAISKLDGDGKYLAYYDAAQHARLMITHFYVHRQKRLCFFFSFQSYISFSHFFLLTYNIYFIISYYNFLFLISFAFPQNTVLARRLKLAHQRAVLRRKSEDEQLLKQKPLLLPSSKISFTPDPIDTAHYSDLSVLEKYAGRASTSHSQTVLIKKRSQLYHFASEEKLQAAEPRIHFFPQPSSPYDISPSYLPNAASSPDNTNTASEIHLDNSEQKDNTNNKH